MYNKKSVSTANILVSSFFNFHLFLFTSEAATHCLPT